MNQPHGLRFPRHARQQVLAACLCLTTVGIVVHPPALAQADNSSLSTTAGYEYYAGPDHQLTRTATGEVEASLRGASASISGARVDDEGAGVGLKLGAGVRLPIAPRTQVKLEAERALGDSSYAAWTLKAGPAFDLLRGQTLSLRYVRVEDNESAITNGASVELEGPLVPDHLSGSGAVSYTKIQDLGGVEGTAGLSWTPLDHIEIEGDAGYTQTGISLDHLFSSKHVIGTSRQKGQKGTTGLEKTPGMTAQLAVRFSFP